MDHCHCQKSSQEIFPRTPIHHRQLHPQHPRRLLLIGSHQDHLSTFDAPENTHQWLVVVPHLSYNAKQRKTKEIVKGISSSIQCALVNKGTSKSLNISEQNPYQNNPFLHIKTSTNYDFKQIYISKVRNRVLGSEFSYGLLMSLAIKYQTILT